MSSLRSLIRDGRFYYNWRDSSLEAVAAYNQMVRHVIEMLKSHETIMVNAQSVWNDLVPGIEERDIAAWDRAVNYPAIPQPKPPFRRMWIEATAEGWQKLGALVQRDNDADLEAFITAMRCSSQVADTLRNDNPKTLVNVHVFHDYNGSACWDGEIIYWLDACGNFVSSYRQVAQVSGFDDKDQRGQTARVKLREGWILHTFARLNCHNVKLVPMKAAMPSPRHMHKHRALSSVWHEIVVEAVQERTKKDSMPSGEKRELRFHRVRGHYADYTKGAGLFGRYKIRLWVEEHARGNRELGEVVGSYIVQ